MSRLLPVALMALTACAPAAQENDLVSSGTSSSSPAAAVGPSPSAVSASANPAPSPAEPAAAAEGRRILSTAFVRVGPDNLLTVFLRGGRELVLRDVAMRAKDYCGVVVSGAAAGKYCGDYADIADARPGGPAAPPPADLAAPNPLPPRS